MISNLLLELLLHAAHVGALHRREDPQLFGHLPEREFVIDNLLVRIHLFIEMILVDGPRAMGV